jgi:hypothetical protein
MARIKLRDGQKGRKAMVDALNAIMIRRYA